MIYGIEEQVYERLMTYFKNNSQIQKVILFGSRAKNLEKLNSDIDLCITYTGDNKGTTIFELEECVGIYSLDVVFEGAIGETLKRQIDRDGKVIYKKEKHL